MSPGTAYWIVDIVREQERKHLHLVLTHPEPDADGNLQVAVVNVSTVRKGPYDDTVVLKKSDYVGFTEQQYYVAYGFANFEKVEDIQFKQGYASEARPFSPQVFDKVFDGLFKPLGNTPADIREYCSNRVSAVPGKVRNLTEEARKTNP